LIIWPKLSLALNSKTVLKPHKTIGSLHDPEISNTRFDNNSQGEIGLVFG
jgi:hypothetical protein